MASVTYEVVPHQGVGSVRLGAHQCEVRSVMDHAPEEFFKSPEDVVPTDAFHDAAFQVFYDRSRRVAYIELSPAEDFEVRFDGLPVLTLPADEVVGHVLQHAPFDERDPELGYSYVFRTLDLALWRPVLPESATDEEGRTFLTVGIGRPGYFGPQHADSHA